MGRAQWRSFQTLSSALGLSVLTGALLLLPGGAGRASADIILSYSSPFDAGTHDGRTNGGPPFAGPDPMGSNTPNFVLGGMTAMDFDSSGAGLTTILGIIDPHTTTRDPDTYMEWGWTASAAIDLTSLKVAYGPSRFFGEGPRQMEIDLSVNGGAFVTIHTDHVPNHFDEPIDFHDIDLSAFTGVTSATFRAFPFDSDGGGGGDINFFNFANPSDPGGLYSAIRVEGVAAAPVAAPEPSVLCLMGLGALSYSGAARLRSWRRRRGKAD